MCISLPERQKNMEKRIRVVWILSLLSVMLLILVQGYWLYHQYVYVVNTYTDELAQQILQEARKEYELRKANTNTTYMFFIDSNAEYKGKENGRVRMQNKLKFLMKTNDVPDSTQLSVLNLDSISRYTERLASSTDSLKLNINTKLSQTEMVENANRALTNHFNPFTIERLDSILIAGFQDMKFVITDRDANDSIYTSKWETTGTIFKSGMRVSYVYSPFQKKGVYIDVTLPALPVFHKMVVQLFLALGIVLLLIGCLVFQIKTILKQKKIGELRQSFVHTMIHELKRPVQTLKTFIAFLADKELRADQGATEEVIQDSMFELDNLSAYLNKLKDMVRADNEKTPLNPTVFDLRELTEKVIRITHIPEGKRVTFITNFDMDSTCIEADPIHLANVLSNLIENAIKYSNAEVEIKIDTSRKGRELWLTVSDNGIGIPLIDQDKVFAKFYRGSNLPERNTPGLGLGLSYVKLIGEAHRGSVSLKSAIGQGTSVTLCLPQ